MSKQFYAAKTTLHVFTAKRERDEYVAQHGDARAVTLAEARTLLGTDAAKKNNEWRRRSNAKRVAAGRCVVCGEPAATRYNCRKCADRHNAASARWQSKNRKRVNEWRRTRDAQRVADGLCVTCGSPSVTRECSACKQKYRQGPRNLEKRRLDK